MELRRTTSLTTAEQQRMEAELLTSIFGGECFQTEQGADGSTVLRLRLPPCSTATPDDEDGQSTAAVGARIELVAVLPAGYPVALPELQIVALDGQENDVRNSRG